MDNTQNHEELSDELPYTIDFFTPADAPGVVELFRAVYGEHYPVRAVYDPDELIRQEKTGDAYRMVARSPSGEVVGHISVYRSTPPNPELYEAGCLMVRHDYRQTDLSFTLFTALTTRLVQKYNIGKFWGEAVCNHLFTQHSAIREGFIETALEMDLMPASAYTAPGAQSVGGRVSVLTVFHISDSTTRAVFLPPCYNEFMRFLYAPFEKCYTFLSGDTQFLPEIPTAGTIQIFPEAGVSRIILDNIGEDCEEWIKNQVLSSEEQQMVVIQVFIKMDNPYTGQVAKVLHEQGFFLGGILPYWFGCDGFIMQKIVGTPFFEGTHVYSKRAKQIKEFVQNDWHTRSSG